MTEDDGASAPIAEDARTRARDTDVWRIATWLVPVAVQAVMAFGAGVMWLLSRGPFRGHDAFGALVLTGAIITTALSLLVGGYASRSKESPRRRAVGLSVAGSGVALLVGATVYALWLLPWLEPGD